MGIVKIGYGDQVVNYNETTGEIFHDASGGVYMISADNEAIILRQFDTEQQAIEGKATLIQRIGAAIPKAEGNGDIIVTIDDL